MWKGSPTANLSRFCSGTSNRNKILLTLISTTDGLLPSTPLACLAPFSGAAKTASTALDLAVSGPVCTTSVSVGKKRGAGLALVGIRQASGSQFCGQIMSNNGIAAMGVVFPSVAGVQAIFLMLTDQFQQPLKPLKPLRNFMAEVD